MDFRLFTVAFVFFSRKQKLGKLINQLIELSKLEGNKSK